MKQKTKYIILKELTYLTAIFSLLTAGNIMALKKGLFLYLLFFTSGIVCFRLFGYWQTKVSQTTKTTN